MLKSKKINCFFLVFFFFNSAKYIGFVYLFGFWSLLVIAKSYHFAASLPHLFHKDFDFFNLIIFPWFLCIIPNSNQALFFCIFTLVSSQCLLRFRVPFYVSILYPLILLFSLTTTLHFLIYFCCFDHNTFHITQRTRECPHYSLVQAPICDKSHC
jgi:hypothetical protein